MFDAHRDDPEFGYRFLADEAREAGEVLQGSVGITALAHFRWRPSYARRMSSATTGIVAAEIVSLEGGAGVSSPGVRR
ncbi:hypothetical protein C5E46_00040 [Nocardia nova]|nr:hypothetical protein C5E46_00040 [Nocardia nova]